MLLALLQARPTPTNLRLRSDESDYVSDEPSSYSSAQVPFTPCKGHSFGEVSSMEISPCERNLSSDPCTFRHGVNYTISLGFVSHRNSSLPRSSVVAQDGTQSYAYSGQSFNACRYSHCPIVAEQASTYVYQFHTLRSSFNYLTFNVSDNFEGPSLFCAGTAVRFEL
ncbi:hypothetical protein CROQUDRAFT_50535 [Cronartium quercuum f. sp. fusiforme G11]|uniref:Phosphatidylglycerol/phosphatidylinositol transfer protein n=1 Tax=Cronartium quercuum f. sp. fusiforme G11 TaxID=708437 RepID=A0A9P6NDZ4_9BASI|nr:hypothetical protein CROQUDRAFT_50535 [Cronartium quercuum f. sp. fusiforme G11]